jgi:hypothetical protein
MTVTEHFRKKNKFRLRVWFCSCEVEKEFVTDLLTYKEVSVFPKIGVTGQESL